MGRTFDCETLSENIIFDCETDSQDFERIVELSAVDKLLALFNGRNNKEPITISILFRLDTKNKKK